MFVRDARFSGMLRSTDWLLVTDVSGQPIGLIFKDQVVLVNNYKSALRGPGEQRSANN